MVRAMVLAAFALGLLGFSGPVLAQGATPESVIKAAVEEVIQPGFAGLADAAKAESLQMETLCAAPDAQALAGAQEGFKTLVLAFSRVEFITFGPLSADNRLERLLFWPDRKGIALRQVQAILADEDASAAEPETLKAKSVAVQGLSALEFVLFGTGSETLASAEGDFRCRYGKAIATVLSDLTAQIAREWADPDGIAGRMENPSDGNGDFRIRREVLEVLTGAIAHGIETIRDTRLLPVLTADGKTPKPRSGLFWRSDMTVPSIAENFAGISDLFYRSNIAQLAEADFVWVDGNTRLELAKAGRTARSVTKPLAEAVEDPEQRKALGELITLTRSLQTLTGETLAGALGLSVGFSSLDGD